MNKKIRRTTTEEWVEDYDPPKKKNKGFFGIID